MLILIAIVFIIIWSLIMGSIYSIFSPFIENIKNITDYNVAYYGAISGAERAELTLKYHWPGFEWSWWYMWSTNQRWPDGDQKTNFNNIEFGKLTKSSNWFYRNIKSRTSWKIPENGKWNIDLELQKDIGTDSEAKNYNKLEPNMSEEIWLDIDTTPISTANKYYQPWYTTTRNVPKIDFYFRLNPLTKDKFWNLDSNTDNDKDWKGNDAVINRSFAWTYINWTNQTPFSIHPYIKNTVVYDNDTMIREVSVNQHAENKITFENWQNPFYWTTITNSWQNMIPPITSLTWASFASIFGNNGNVQW